MQQPNLTRHVALEELRRTRILTTAMLKPLNVEFESFLRFSQLPLDVQARIVEQLIHNLEARTEH